jgi:hypothetical protein
MLETLREPPKPETLKARAMGFTTGKAVDRYLEELSIDDAA